MRRFSFAVALLLALAVVTSCANKKKKDKFTDTATSGLIYISADESFRPIVDQEIDVFESKLKDASIIPLYTDEVEAINLLLKDSVRLAITTRQLTEQEMNYLHEKKFFPKEVKIATDAVALIVNRQNADSLITVSELSKIVTGEITTWDQLRKGSKLGNIEFVFDNKNSSTVRYAIDSLAGGKPLSENLKAQGTNAAVIDLVASNPGAIGVIGVSWVGNKSDTTNLSFSDRVRVLAVSREAVATPEDSFKPYQAYIAVGKYPLTRDVYVINNDPKYALSSAFANFLSSFVGQRIILKTGVMPATQPVRVVDVREEL